MGHHFNPLNTIIIPPSMISHPNYELVFVNTDKGEQVRVTIPRYGMFDDPTREITRSEVDAIANDIAYYLEHYTGSSGSNVTPAP